MVLFRGELFSTFGVPETGYRVVFFSRPIEARGAIQAPETADRVFSRVFDIFGQSGHFPTKKGVFGSFGAIWGVFRDSWKPTRGSSAIHVPSLGHRLQSGGRPWTGQGE